MARAHCLIGRVITVGCLLAAMLALGGTLGVSAARASEMRVLDWTLGYQIQYNLSGGGNKNAYTAEMKIRLDDFGDMLAYCVDLGQTINKGVNYDVTLNPLQDHPISTLQAAWLMGHYAPGLGLAGGGYSLSASISALQIAIWEVIYDHANQDLASGSFVLKNVYGSESDTVKQLATQYLSNLPTHISSTGLTIAGVARSPDVQDLLYGKNTGGAVPEPGSLLLFGSAAACLGWWRRRQARANPAA